MAGKMYIGSTQIKKIYLGSTQIKKVYLGSSQVYISGNICTYVVDTNVSYSEEVEAGASCLSPTSFTPTKSGWTFVGWREDTTASSSVLSTKTMGDDPITLYAVFKAGVTITKYNASNTASTDTQYKYYNNGNTLGATFTLSEGAISGWTKAGWTNNASGYTATVADGGTVTLTAAATYYTLYTAGITVTKYVNGSGGTQTETKNRIANVHNTTTYSNPSFTLTEPDLSGWTKYGWADAADFTADVGNGGSVTLSANKTYYALYYQSITVTYYNNSATASSTSKNRNVRAGSSWSFSNPTFNLTVTAVSGWSVRGWSTSSAANAGITYNSATNFTRDSSCILYASWSKTCTVSYNGNGNTGGSTAANSGTAYRGYKGDVTNASVKLQSNGFAKRGWSFSKWALNGTGGTQYAAGTNISINANATMYAIWTYSSAKYVVQNGVVKSGTGSNPWGGGIYNATNTADSDWGYGAQVWNWPNEGTQMYFTPQVTFDPAGCTKITYSGRLCHEGDAFKGPVNGVFTFYNGNTLVHTSSTGQVIRGENPNHKTTPISSFSYSFGASTSAKVVFKVYGNDYDERWGNGPWGGGILNVYCGT